MDSHKPNIFLYYFDLNELVPPNEFHQKWDVLNSTYQLQEIGDIVGCHLCIIMLHLLRGYEVYYDSLMLMQL